MLNQKKLMFPFFQFDLIRDAIDAPEGLISWHIFHEVYEKDRKPQDHLRKAHKVTYQVTHSGNNKVFI